MSTVAYVRTLENKVGELEHLLQLTGQPTPDNTAREATQSGADDEQPQDVIETMVDAPNRPGTQEDDSASTTTMAENDTPGFGGLSLLSRLHGLCEHVRTTGNDPRSAPSWHQSNNDLRGAFDVTPPESTPPISWDAFAMLPSRDGISHAIDVVVRVACCNLQFLDHRTLHTIADDALQATECGSITQSRKPLSLLFAVLALARRFEPDSSATRTSNGPQQSSEYVSCYCGPQGPGLSG